MYKKILFFLTLFLAAFLRLFLLSHVPPSASLDEATIGWNAYSLLHTGKDEYGNFLPMLLRAYDDYRPALYVYLVVPFVQVFGLSVFAVRLPSVILSISTVAMTFLFVRNIFFTHKKREVIAFITMLLFSLSPWHIYLSRLGHEVNLGLTLIVAALLFFSYFFAKNNPLYFVVSCIFFAVSFYSYQSEKIFTPLILFTLIILSWRSLMQYKKHFFVAIILFGIISIPIFFASLTPGALLRLKGTTIFTDNPQYMQSASHLLSDKKNHNVIGLIMDNRRVISIEIFLQNYAKHFSFAWLFGNSGNEEFKAPNTGLLYMWESAFLLIGFLYILFTKTVDKKIKLFFILWILIDFIAPGITTGAPHAMRAFTLLPLPYIFIASGIVAVTTNVQKQSKGIAIGLIIILSIVAFQEFSQFFDNYFVLFPMQQSDSFQYPIEDAMQYVQTQQSQYKTIVISNKNNLYQSYMFYLFYTKYNPQKYLKNGGTISGGFNEPHVIGSIQFKPIHWNVENKKDTLFIGNVGDFPNSQGSQMQFRLLNGDISILAVGSK